MLSKVTAKNVGDVFLRHTVEWVAICVSEAASWVHQMLIFQPWQNTIGCTIVRPCCRGDVRSAILFSIERMYCQSDKETRMAVWRTQFARCSFYASSFDNIHRSPADRRKPDGGRSIVTEIFWSAYAQSSASPANTYGPVALLSVAEARPGFLLGHLG